MFKDRHRTIGTILVITLLFSGMGLVIENKIPIKNQFTGAELFNDGSGTSRLEILSNVGITIDDALVDLGTGYVTIGEDYAIIDTTNSSEQDWINENGSLNEIYDFHILNNTGSTVSNITISVSDSDINNAEEWLCLESEGCPSNYAKIEVLSEDHESFSCPVGLASSWKIIMNDTSKNDDVQICGNLLPMTNKNTLKVFYRVTLPTDVPTGQKSLNFIFYAEAITTEVIY